MIGIPSSVAFRQQWDALSSRSLDLGRAAKVELRIIGALAMRELTTRFGRRGLGFLWLIVEPLMFTAGVLLVWSLIRQPYEHGVRLAPFIMTGYLPLQLIRHGMSRAALCVSANMGLLFHRQISVLHLFIARLGLEFAGVTVAFVACFLILYAFGLVDPPAQLHLVYLGWLLLGWLVLGIGFVIGALSEMSDVVERLVGILSYLMIPISGAFFMVGWLPDAARPVALAVPFIHCFELIRAGFFGEFVRTYYDPLYAAAWCLGLSFLGLLLLTHVQRHVEVE